MVDALLDGSAAKVLLGDVGVKVGVRNGFDDDEVIVSVLLRARCRVLTWRVGGASLSLSMLKSANDDRRWKFDCLLDGQKVARSDEERC
jgi:hypothetical protein